MMLGALDQWCFFSLWMNEWSIDAFAYIFVVKVLLISVYSVCLGKVTRYRNHKKLCFDFFFGSEWVSESVQLKH